MLLYKTTLIRYAQSPPTTFWRVLRTQLAKLNLAKILPQYKGRAIVENFIPRIFCCIRYQRACHNNHCLADIIWERIPQKHLKCSCSDLLTAVLRVVSCEVWFGLRSLMQLASKYHNIFLINTVYCNQGNHSGVNLFFFAVWAFNWAWDAWQSVL